VLQVPYHVRRVATTTSSRPAVLQQRHRCPTCVARVDSRSLFDVPYKLIIECEELPRGARKQQKVVNSEMAPDQDAQPAISAPSMGNGTAPAAKQDVEEVPPSLLLLHPRLTRQEYRRYRHDIVFQHKVASVCEGCYLKFSTPQLGTCSGRPGESPVQQDESLPMGTRDLEPERLRRRYQATMQKLTQQQAEEDGWCEEQSKQEQSERPCRAQSCPKLPSWSQRLSDILQSAPAPVPSCQPPVPHGAPPIGRLEPVLAPEQHTRRHRHVAPLRGQPYLRELQAFAVRCESRVGEVLGPKAWADANTGRTSKTRAPKARSAKATSNEGQKEATIRAGDQVKRDPKKEARGLSLEVAELSDSDGEDPLVAKLLGKWPPTCGSMTPTTLPPSRGEGVISIPSSYHGSRPSTRTSSALGALGRRQLPTGTRKRPSSSPHVMRSAADGSLHRPSSSPHLGAKPPWPQSLRGISAEHRGTVDGMTGGTAST